MYINSTVFKFLVLKMLSVVSSINDKFLVCFIGKH